MIMMMMNISELKKKIKKKALLTFLFNIFMLKSKKIKRIVRNNELGK